MSDLVEFLTARFDEDEQVARYAAEGTTGDLKDDSERERSTHWTFVERAHGFKVVDSLGYSIVEEYDVSAEPWAFGPHIARHDPARVLAEVEAKRRVVDLHGTGPHECVAWDELLGATCTCYELDCPTLCLLALPYTGHPDYRQEWALRDN